MLFSFKFVYMQVADIPNLDRHKVAVTDILMACQNYMREKKVFNVFVIEIYVHANILQDECSFVSLRDIERAMMILKWFHSVIDHIERDDLYEDTVCNCFDSYNFYIYIQICTEM